MKHYLLNITWRCQNAGICRYCWVNQTVRQRPELLRAEERPLADWVRAIHRDRPDLVDIAGGEPLLVDWLPDLLRACPTTLFGISTNGLAHQALIALMDSRPRNLLSINVSWHPDAAAHWKDYERIWRASVLLARMHGYPVGPNVVAFGDNVERSQPVIEWMAARGIRPAISPYERMDVLDEKTAAGLVCRGGIDHLTVAPDGEAWPCLTTLRSPYWKETALGNWLDGTVDIGRKVQPCHLYCLDHYVLETGHQAGDMWGVKARPA